MASKGKGGRGISAEKMKSMAKWIEINQEIDEAHDDNLRKAVSEDFAGRRQADAKLFFEQIHRERLEFFEVNALADALSEHKYHKRYAHKTADSCGNGNTGNAEGRDRPHAVDKDDVAHDVEKIHHNVGNHTFLHKLI